MIAVLKDAGRLETPFGRLVVAGSSIAEVGTIVLLTRPDGRDVVS